MSKKTSDNKRTTTASTADFLRASPQANRAMKLKPASDGGVLAEIPMNRPGWLVAPLSWIVPFSPYRRVKLDAVGFGLLKLCNGAKKVETIIEEFAKVNKLSFREAQLPVTQFLQQMTERGIVAIVGLEQEAGRT